MIEGALSIELSRQAGLVQLPGDLRGQLWCAGCRILHGIQRSRETAEVVPGFGMLARRQQQALAFPVGRHHDYGFGSWQIGGQFSQCRAAGARLQSQHGRTVGNEQGGQHGDQLLK